MADPQKDFAITEILRQMGDKTKYPTMTDVVIALRRVQGLTLEAMGQNFHYRGDDAKHESKGISGSIVGELQKQCVTSPSVLKRVAEEGLQLKPNAVKALLKERARRRQTHIGSHSNAVKFAKAIHSALAFHGKNIEELGAEIKLAPNEEKLLGFTLSNLIFSLRDQDRIIDGFKALLKDPHYDLGQMLRDAEGEERSAQSRFRPPEGRGR